MRLIAYLRVSTDLQAEQGMGLDIQRKGVRAYAKGNGHSIVCWYSDEGVSGSNGLDTRQGLLDALNELEDHSAAGLVVYRLDRLARKLTVQEATLARVWALGCSVYSVDLGEVPQDDPDDPMRTALRQMVGVFAQLERGMIAARLRAGRRLKDERGGYAGGAPRFGVRAEGRELVQDEREQHVIARIRELHDQGQSSRLIADALNGEGLPSKRGGSWSSATVARVVRSFADKH
jgi:DNA invertase Pin-like site-specific DNA recombinase